MTVLSAPTSTGPPAEEAAAPAPGRAPVLLDVLVGLSVFAGLSWTVTLVLDGQVPVAWYLGYLALVLTMAALWVARRLRERRSARVPDAWVVAFAVLGTVGLFGADGPGAWPLFMMALLWVVGSFGPRSGALLVVAVMAVQTVAFLVQGHPVGDTALQVAGSGYVFGFGLVLAWLMAEHVRQRQQIADLLVEARRGTAVEVELVLADERSRAARDLHDGLAHRLTLIGMALAYAQRVRDRDADRAWEQVERARAEAGEALTTMRRWVRALNPVRIEGTSLADALDAVAESFRGTGLDVVVHAGPTGPATEDEALERGVTLFVHRFVQEGLTNTLRHSTASRVDVTYGMADDTLRLAVADDGSPGPAGRPTPTPGFGLRTLGERAAELGGRLETGWSGSGLTVSAELPAHPPVAAVTRLR